MADFCSFIQRIIDCFGKNDIHRQAKETFAKMQVNPKIFDVFFIYSISRFISL